MNRTVKVIRLQLVNKQTYIWVPLLILAGAWALTLLVFSLIPVDGVKVGGGSQAPLWYFLFVGVQALTMSFPFSQALSLTRRQFFAGTLLTAAITSAILATIFAIGGWVEVLTRGYGMNGYFFYLDWLWAPGWWAAWLTYFVVAMLLFVTGFWGATIYKRGGALMLTIVLVGLGLLFVGGLWLVGRSNGWGVLFGWMAEQGSLGLTAWGALLTAVLAGVSFLTLRRAVP